ncbi:hypothetical protein EV649_0924 [Kribbella sp. VKM Ac-2569]|uniref:hypothetical protein n=1 Tax=Kribbella sp. VKM Ac-2569 TaxID=2512220 RepID=UPI00102CADF8|nr:hypothetical protein [Kribbella sp. VKM Ac-2569]RZT27170.1 hypothetical protein EV649_0924 [Kribbella sp. VKM Ac-2569]
MTDDTRYLIVGIEKAHQDVHFLRRQARASSAARQLYREVLREIERLRTGATDGHHALGCEPGKGDLRDCVTAYVRSDPARKADYRLVFREMGPAAPGERPRREILAVKPRRGPNDVYAHVCARLSRHPDDQQPGLNRFGDRRPDARGSQVARQAELDTKRAIAHAWSGQQPLSSTRALLPAGASRGIPEDQARAAAVAQYAEPRRSLQWSGSDPTPGRPQPATGYPRPARRTSGPTGWPTRER